MALTLSELVNRACNTAAALGPRRHSEAPSVGRAFLSAFGADPSEIRKHHAALISARDASAGRLYGWSFEEAERGELKQEPGILLHQGVTWGLLADDAPKVYWPSDKPGPNGLDRELWSETLLGETTTRTEKVGDLVENMSQVLVQELQEAREGLARALRGDRP